MRKRAAGTGPGPLTPITEQPDPRRVSPRWPADPPFLYRHRNEGPDTGEQAGLGGDSHGLLEGDQVDIGEMMGLENLTRTRTANQQEVDRYDFQGFDVVVEHPAGSTRKWDGGETLMRFDYGYLDGFIGADKDDVDVYVGPDESAEWVYVIHQMKVPEFEQYDEDKVLIGFGSPDEAVEAYLAHYDDDRFYGGMSVMTPEQLRERLELQGERPGKITHEAKMNKIAQDDYDRHDVDYDRYDAARDDADDRRDAEVAEMRGYAEAEIYQISLKAGQEGVVAIQSFVHQDDETTLALVENQQDDIDFFFLVVGDQNGTVLDVAPIGDGTDRTAARQIANQIHQGADQALALYERRFIQMDKRASSQDDAAIARGNDLTLCGPETAKVTSKPFYKQKGGSLKQKIVQTVRTATQSRRGQVSKPMAEQLDRHFDTFVQARHVEAAMWLRHERGAAINQHDSAATVKTALHDASLRESLKDHYWNDFVLRLANTNPQQNVEELPAALLHEILYDLERADDNRDLTVGEESTRGIVENETEKRKIEPLKRAESRRRLGRIDADQIAEAVGREFGVEPKRKAAKRLGQTGLRMSDELLGLSRNIGTVKDASADLDFNIFDDEVYSQADRALASLSVDRLADSRPRMLTRPHELINKAADRFYRVARQFKGYTLEDKHLERIVSEKVASDGRVIFGSLIWHIRLADHYGRRRLALTITQPVIDGEPSENVKISTSAGKEVALTQASLDRLAGVRRDSRETSHQFAETELSHIFEE
jgi:hypothetical protein